MRLFALVAVLSLAGCATARANLGDGAAERMTQTVALAAAPAEAFRLVAQGAVAQGWTVTQSDAAAGIVQTTYPQTMGRWTDTVAFTVAADSAQGSVVTARSGLANGPNVRYVRAFLDGLAAR